MAKALFTTLFTVMLVGYLAAQGSIGGKVIDDKGQALAFATVAIDTLKKGVATDDNGSYRIENVPAGTYKVSVSMMGYEKQYQTVKVVSKGTATLHFTMATSTNSLGEVEVSAKGKDDAQRLRDLLGAEHEA